MNTKPMRLPASAEIDSRLRIVAELRNLCLRLGRARVATVSGSGITSLASSHVGAATTDLNPCKTTRSTEEIELDQTKLCMHRGLGMIVVNTHEAKSRLSALLTAVEDQDEVVLICRHGKPVAELRAASDRTGGPDPLQMHPQLAATILYDPTEPASEDEWPSEFH